MKVVMFQAASPDGEFPAERVDRVRDRVVAEARGADLVMLPELWAVGFNHFGDYVGTATTLKDSPSVCAVVEIARQTGAWVHGGSFIERCKQGGLSNTAFLVAPDGSVRHTYRKIHTFGYRSREAELLRTGDSISGVSTPFGTISAVTCYDLRFPGLWDVLGGSVAPTLVAIPAAWPAARIGHWDVLTRARAIENQAFLLACNASGSHGGTALGGRSRIVHPTGDVIVEGGDDEDFVHADIDTGAVDALRVDFPVLQDRRTDYALLFKEVGAQ